MVCGPGGDHGACVSQGPEHGLVERSIPHPPVEAFDDAVPHRPSRRGAMPFDPALGPPAQDGVGGRFRAVVADNHAGLAAPLDRGGQHGAPRSRVSHRSATGPGPMADGIAARHSRATSSTASSTRKRWPLANGSCTKSGDPVDRQSFARQTTGGAAPRPGSVPVFRRPCAGLSVRAPSIPLRGRADRSRTARPRGAMRRRAADSQTGGAHAPRFAADRAAPCPEHAAPRRGPSCDPPRPYVTPAVPGARAGTPDARPPRASRQAPPLF